jgi:trimethylamine--corrinoid protein Co-methyltransferase
LNLPTHAYLGLSDTKILDMQSGIETGMGALLAGIKGVNMISGAGMIDFETTQSIQKVIIDNEVCGMIHRFIKGIEQRDDPIAKPLLKELVKDDVSHLLAHDHTLKWFKDDHYIPSTLIDRATNEEWINKGRKTIGQRAKERIPKMLTSYPEVKLEKNDIMELAKKLDYKELDIDLILKS